MSNLYAWIQNRELNDKPWRGSQDYPISKRTHRHKYFRVRDENGNKVYDIYYGNSYSKVEISNDDYALLTAEEKQQYHQYPSYSNTGIGNTTQVWTRWETIPNLLLTIRSDDTVEIVKDSEYLHQGERGYISYFIHATVRCEGRRGGAIAQIGWGKSAKYIPIFKGLRIHAGALTPHASTDYEIITRKVNRSQAGEMLTKYENMFKVAETMCGVMDRETFLQQTIDTMKDNGFSNTEWFYGSELTDVIEKGMEVLDTDPAGAFMLFSHGFVNQTFRSAVRNGQFNSWSYEDTISIMGSTKKKLLRKLYKDYDVFNKTVIKSDEQRLPSSVWDIEIMVNGQEVAQYK